MKNKLSVGIYSEKRHRSYLLYYFLKRFTKCTYFNEPDYKKHISKSYDILFVSVSTEIEFNLNDVNAKKIVLFDTWDSSFPYNKTNLLSKLEGEVDLYLKYALNKNHTDKRFNYKFLPLPRRKLDRHILPLKKLSERKKLVDFIGSSTIYASEGIENAYNQRLEWLSELKNQNIVDFDGGIADSPAVEEMALFTNNTNFRKEVEPFFIPKIKHRTFNTRLKNTIISLCPAGVERWTYRHIESIHAKSIVLSTELSDIKTLTPFPTEHFVVVKDNEPILPYIEDILSKIDTYQKHVDDAYMYWNQFYSRGFYPKKRLFDHFISQIEI